jgi:hypothetical protein
MLTRLKLRAFGLLRDILAPDQSPAEEEPLFGRKAAKRILILFSLVCS